MREITEDQIKVAIHGTHGLAEFNNLHNAVTQGYLAVIFFELHQLWQKAASSNAGDAKVLSQVIWALEEGKARSCRKEPHISALNQAIINATANSTQC